MGINLIFDFTWYIDNSVNNWMSNAISGKIIIYPVYVDIISFWYDRYDYLIYAQWV